MGFSSDYKTLNSYYNISEKENKIPGTDIIVCNFNYDSEVIKLLLGDNLFPGLESHLFSHLPDKEIRENNVFSYSVFINQKRCNKEYDRAIILFHGLNERSWNKYLCWAKYIVEHTDCAVILFPMAFHMNRSPASWADRRKMAKLLADREKRYRHNHMASIANVAISERLYDMPERFVYSGFQTLYDSINLIKYIMNGNHPLFVKSTTVDVFGYSIGAFISQILMLANPDNMFEKSKFVLFCGGATFNRMNSMSRYILDRLASNKLRMFYLNEKKWKKSTRIFKSLVQGRDFGNAFRAMLNSERLRNFRDEIFYSFSKQIKTIALLKDNVIPGAEILKTLQGSKLLMPLKVNILDFPYPYTHEVPFPISSDEALTEKVDKAFDLVFGEIARFLNT